MLSIIFYIITDRQSVKRKEKILDSKRNFNRFLLLWAGELVSSIGGGLTSFGLGVYVFGRTGSAANMALVTFLAFLPTLLLCVPAILFRRFVNWKEE